MFYTYSFLRKLNKQAVLLKNSTVPTKTTTTKFFILLFIFILEKE